MPVDPIGFNAVQPQIEGVAVAGPRRAIARTPNPDVVGPGADEVHFVIQFRYSDRVVTGIRTNRASDVRQNRHAAGAGEIRVRRRRHQEGGSGGERPSLASGGRVQVVVFSLENQQVVGAGILGPHEVARHADANLGVRTNAEPLITLHIVYGQDIVG